MMCPLHILAADMGGTTSRFGHFTLQDATLALHGTAECPTAQLRHTADALAVAARTGCAPEAAHALAWAVAGPVSGAHALEARFTNAALRLDLRSVAASGTQVFLFNDFAAQAWATLAQPGEQALTALPGAVTEEDAATEAPRVRGILGPGTGLGTASLLRDGQGRWTALCAEGGHAAFPFRDGPEDAYAAFARSVLRVPYLSCEHVLSGDGLERLHRFLTGEEASAQDIAAAHLQTPDPTHPTLRWFGRFLGRMCRHWALNTLCVDGLYVAGGVVGKNPLLLCNAAFTEEFFDGPGHMLPLLRRIPVRLMRDARAGLWGAARAAQALYRA